MTNENRPKQINKITGWITVGVAGGILGVMLPRLIRYLRALFSQPQLPSRAIPSETSFTSLEAAAYAIATDNLRAGIERRRLESGEEKWVLCAGLRNFREPWARDFGFASSGLMELGLWDVTREGLEVFFLTQHENGQFAVKVHSTSVLDRYLHSLFKREQPIHAPIRPKFITAHNTISLDGNGLLIIAALNYATRNKDAEFVREHWSSLLRALSWLDGFADADGLLQQGAFTDWADSVDRQGKVLYTNMIYWKALQEMANAAQTFGDERTRQALIQRAGMVHDAVQAYFWRDDLGYFVTSKLFNNLSSAGNLLAIAWGLATESQGHQILDAMRFFAMAEPVPTQTVHRAYPRKFIAIENRLGGIADYHTYFAWLWIGGWHVIACTKLGRYQEAQELLYRMSRAIVRDGEVHEVYAPTGRFASNLWYTSEAPLTWSAGMFVHAYHVLERALQRSQLD
jgi:glycogen debranching enzyme